MDNRENQRGALSRRPQRSDLTTPSNPWNPWAEMEQMRRRMDALFGRTFGFDLPAFYALEPERTGALATTVAEPDMDIYENDNEYIIHAALPGVDPQDIKVEATEDSITLNAEHRSPFPNQGAGQTAQDSQGQQAQAPQPPTTHHRQSRYSSYQRFHFAYSLPTEIDPNAVQANFRNGRLELHLPKRQPVANKAIPVSIQADGQSQPSRISGMRQGSAAFQTAPQTGEGAPNQKMGQPYAPSAGEDHTAQAQAAGMRETVGQTHQRGSDVNNVASGQTNPAQPVTSIPNENRTP